MDYNLHNPSWHCIPNNNKYEGKMKMIQWSLIGLGLTILWLVIDTHIL